ncbi:hypothetical protein NDU88_001901 [Pleurodeles waltl]|uniref:Uncharacterized protein n=1 Tax=Pleurodeles waltl TaxID=8319 RepID=A0AAV7KXF0_PLEWA|nr:hypothetical protein NDU88_001901 [Pleurodeles waltl]
MVDSPPLSMGKSEAKQQRLRFGAGDNLYCLRQSLTSRWLVRGMWRVIPPSTEDIKALTLELKTRLTAIDCRLESLTRCMEDLKDRMDKQHTRLTDAEHYISNVEHVHNQQVKTLEELKVELCKVQLKNEYLEARYRNNICILGIPESTVMGCTDDYIENLLLNMFGALRFSQSFLIEQAHRSLAP